MGAQLPLDANTLPIPRDVAPGPGWSAQMREMADCIGAYETLLISDRHGGQDIYIPADPKLNPFLPLIGAAKSRTLAHVYRRETITIPTAGYALRRARRGSVIAAIRAGEMTVAGAAKLLGMRRDYLSKLVNGSDEGCGVPALRTGARPDPRQLDMFGQTVTPGGG